MTDSVGHVPESVKQRLINLSRKRGVPANELMQFYAMERFLYRLGSSPYRDRLILKGALMLQAWRLSQTRSTRDIDLLGMTSNELDHIARLVKDICVVDIPRDDGMQYVPDSVQAIRIKEDAEYEGVRVTFKAFMGSARLPMQIDIGFNDVITPGPQPVEYPVLLDHPAPALIGYTPETVVAEKIEAMATLDVLNSRMKDFFDIWLLSRHVPFDLMTLCAAVGKTLARRGTKLSDIPTLLKNPDVQPDKQRQWAAFLRKSPIPYAPAHFNEVAASILNFLAPVFPVLIAGNTAPRQRWSPPGPWR